MVMVQVVVMAVVLLHEGLGCVMREGDWETVRRCQKQSLGVLLPACWLRLRCGCGVVALS